LRQNSHDGVGRDQGVRIRDDYAINRHLPGNDHSDSFSDRPDSEPIDQVNETTVMTARHEAPSSLSNQPEAAGSRGGARDQTGAPRAAPNGTAAARSESYS
jgi:hypothetical protein